MSVEISPKLTERIHSARYLMLTTVRADGMPQPTPIWFIYENGEFLIYSQPQAQKVKNIRQNPKVALSLVEDVEGEAFFVVMGEARIVENAPLSIDVPAYVDKYREDIPAIGLTPQSLAETYSTTIRVKPTQVREQ
jgi:PPOX class probable F420-dependent enzyme